MRHEGFAASGAQSAAEGCDEERSHRVRKKMRISSDTVNQETGIFRFPHHEWNTD